MKEDNRARASCFPMSLKSKKKNAMCADSGPALRITLISWMIAELRKHKLSGPQGIGDHVRKNTFTSTGCGKERL